MGFLAFLILLVVSVLLVTTGWRGRRVGEAPHCKACAFDLSGLADEQPRCPECGGDITASSATVVGVRRRRPRRLGVGLAGLALCATLGWFGVQGKLSSASVVSVLPSKWMIGYAVRAEGRPFAATMQWELMKRAQAGTLGDAAEQRLADGLEIAMEHAAGSPALSRLTGLVDRLAANPSTSAEVRRQLAAWMLDRADKTDAAWGRGWGSALAVLRADGLLSDAEWDELVRAAVTPRIWRLGDGPLAPGEEFVIGIEFLECGLRTQDPGYAMTFDVPEGMLPIRAIGRHHSKSRGLVEGENQLGMPNDYHLHLRRGIMRAPMKPGVFELGVEVQFMEDVGSGLRQSDEQQTQTGPRVVELKSTLRIEVREDAPRLAGEGQTLGEWLGPRVMPAVGHGAESGSPWHSDFAMSIGLAIPLGPFEATGDLLAVTADGTREVLGSFVVEIGRGAHVVRWTRRDGGVYDGSGSGGNEFIQAGIVAQIAPQHLTPGNPDQLLLVFDTLELPDGRTHKGPEPLEVPVPAHPLGWSTPW